MISRVPRLPPALPLVVAPVARPAEISSMRALDVPVDTRRVETGGLAGAAARALAGEYAPAPDVPTRSKPADPPTPRDNFKQAASETLLCLSKLEADFDAIAQLDPDSQPLYLRLRGLSKAIGDRLYNAMDPTTMPQDRLLDLLRAVDAVRQRLSDDTPRPDPGSAEGRREIESLFELLDAALLVPHGAARPPSPGTNFRQAAMEESSVLKALMGFFDPISQLETDSQPLFHKIAGLHRALTDRVFDARNPQGMSQEDLLALLRAAREIKQQVGAKDYKAPDPRTPEGRREIEALFTRLPVFVSFRPADPPTPRDNFKQAASETLLCLSRLEGSFDAISQLEPDSQPLYLRLRGLSEAIGDRLYNAMDPTTMPQDRLLDLLRAADAVRRRLADDASRPDPGSAEGRREIESLFARLDSALLIPHGAARSPSPGTNFRQAAMEEISVLKALMGYFDPLSQLETDSQPLFRKIAGLHQALTDRVFDARNPQGMSQEDLLTLLRAARLIKQQLGAKDFKAPDPRTPEGRREIEAHFTRLPVFVSYRSADPPTDRQNFKQAAGESLSILAKLEGTYDTFARLDEPARSQFLRVVGLSATLGARAFDYHDTSAFTPDRLLGVLRVAREIRWRFSDPAFAPDPGTADGRRELDGLFTMLDSALGLPSIPAAPPSFQDNFRQGGMETLAILDRLRRVFDGIAQLEADTQPLFLKLGGLINTLGDRLYGYRRLGSLHPASLAALLKTLQAIRSVLGDKERHPDPRTAEGRSKVDGFVTTLASQIGLPFA